MIHPAFFGASSFFRASYKTFRNTLFEADVVLWCGFDYTAQNQNPALGPARSQFLQRNSQYTVSNGFNLVYCKIQELP